MPMSTTSNIDCIRLDITQLPILLPIFINKIVVEGVIILNNKLIFHLCVFVCASFNINTLAATNKIKTSMETLVPIIGKTIKTFALTFLFHFAKMRIYIFCTGYLIFRQY